MTSPFRVTAATRRWKSGSTGIVNGIRFRCVAGEKDPDDLRLDMHYDGRWVAVKMELGFMLADFFYENENILYPPSKNKLGGVYYIDECWRAIEHGFRAAAEKLEEEKAAKRARHSQR